MEQYLLVTVFLLFFFGLLVTYRRFVLAEYKIDYVGYGWAIIKALVLAKVVLVGELLHLGERFGDRPLIVSIFWKTLVFGLFIAAFAVAERLVEGLMHHRPVDEEFQLSGPKGYELLARTLLEAVALVPLFAFRELSRVLGEERLHDLLFRGAGTTPRPDPK